MNNNKIRLDYKDTDSKIEIEIYGLNFEINQEIEKIDTKELEQNNDINGLIDKILGNGAVEKINAKRKQDGYEEINTQVALNIFSACLSAYLNASTKPFDKLSNSIDQRNKKFDRYNRRNYRRY